MTRRDEIDTLIAEKKRRLYQLRLHEARFGFHTPPEVLIEIEDVEMAIAWLEQERAKLVEGVAGKETIKPVANSTSTPVGRPEPLQNTEALSLLRQYLAQRFSDSELRTLCFDLGVDYEDLPGAGKGDKARELVAYMQRRGRLDELILAGRASRPDVPWPTLSPSVAALEDKIQEVEAQPGRPIAAGTISPVWPDAVTQPDDSPSILRSSGPEAANSPRLLRVFLSHASEDKPKVREINRRLQSAGIDSWLDEERLLPGQDWQLEIRKAVRAADVVLVCLSSRSMSKAGYVQKELKFALDIADERPEGAIFLVPVKLEACDVPDRLSHLQWVNLYEAGSWERLTRALNKRAEDIGQQNEKPTSEPPPDPAWTMLQEACRVGKLPGWEDFEWISQRKEGFLGRLNATNLAFALKCSLQHGVDLVFWSTANKDNPDAIDVILEPIKKDKGHRPLLRAGYAIEQLSDELRQSLAGRLKLDHIYDEIRKQVIQAALEHRTVDYWKNELIKDPEYRRYVSPLLAQVSDI